MSALRYIADFNFQVDVFKPSHHIEYDDSLNAQILNVVAANHCQYRKVLKNHFSDLYQYIYDCTEHMPDDVFSFTARVFWTLNRWQDFPVCEFEGCNRRLIVTSENKGFRLQCNEDGSLKYKWPRHCCLTHMQRDVAVRNAYKRTCMSRYDVENVFQADWCKSKRCSKLIEKFGADVPAKSSVVLKKMQETYKKRIGYINPFQNPEVQVKSRQTYFNKTGYASIYEDPSIVLKRNQTEIDRFGCRHILIRNKQPGFEQNVLNSQFDEPLFSFEDYCKIDNLTTPLKFRCKKCGKTFESIHNRHHCRCPECFPEDYINHSQSYISALNRRMFMILDAAEIKYEKEFTLHFEHQDEAHTYRRFDIKIGNVLIELNGDYWHAHPDLVLRQHKISPTTILNFVGGQHCTAQEIWDYDAEKRMLAESNGFKVFYLWEHEMNMMSNEDILTWVRKKI